MIAYNPEYAGPSYSVKYLGIVDGSMGVLSRKMAMQRGKGQPEQNRNGQKFRTNSIDPALLNESADIEAYRQPQPRQKSQLNIVKPVLKKNKYSDIVNQR